MQSPEPIEIDVPIDAERIRTRLLGLAVIAGTLLLSPLVLAVLFYFVAMAAHNWHLMVAAFNGVF